MHAIETTKLTRFYGKSRGIVDADLRVHKEKILGFIEPNSAGKTKTILLLPGLLKPNSGEAGLFEEPVPAGSDELYSRPEWSWLKQVIVRGFLDG